MAIAVVPVSLVAVIAAFFILLFIYENRAVIIQAIGSFVTEIPLVGVWLGNNLIALVNTMGDAMVNLIQWGIGPAVDLLWGVYGQASQLLNAQALAVSNLTNAVGHLYGYLIPNRVNALWAGIGAAQVAAIAQAQALYGQAVAHADAIASNLQGNINALHDAVYASIASTLNAAKAYTDQQIAAAVATGTGVSVAVQQFVAGTVQAAVAPVAVVASAAAVAAQQADADAHSLSSQAQAAAMTYTDQQVAGLNVGALGGLAAQVASLAVAVPAVQAAVQAIEDSPCMQECAPLGVLGSTFALIDVAGVLALVAAAWTDPAGTAGEIEATTGAAIGGIVAAAEGLIGVSPAA